MGFRPTVAEVDTGAITANVRRLVGIAEPAAVCAVVKADGYGHGAVASARAAIAGGASWLAVALVEEGLELRDAGLDVPVLLLSEAPADAVAAAVDAELRLTVYSPDAVSAVAAAGPGHPVHLKVDTGMRRVGCAPADAPDLADAIARAGLELEGLWTHLAVADEPENPFTERQLGAFAEVVAAVREGGHTPPFVHAANSAGTIAHPAARLDLVRVGIAAYGISPAPVLAGAVELRPALTLRSAVSFVKPVAVGDGVSYGHHHRVTEPTMLATVPVGYADGVARRLGLTGGEVLIRGRRRPIAGVVTMDQLMVDVGPASDVEVGDEVVLLGTQGFETITATEVAERLETIGYEVTCAIGKRVPRRHHR